MRRYLAGGLLFVLVGQSSGAALATTSEDVRAGVTLGPVIAPVLSAIEGSQIVAQLTGNGNRYSLMHMPMPHFVRPAVTTNPRTFDVSRSRLGRLHHRVGQLEVVHYPSSPPLHRTRDPLAVSAAHALRSASIGPQLGGPQRQSPPVVPTQHLGASKVSIPQQGLLIPRPSVASSSPSPLLGPELFSNSERKVRQNAQPQIAQSDTGAGINRWWTYEERAIPGIGKAMLNVGTGNLVIQATDVDVPERGLDLVMQRTYNSQSLHDANGDDGSEPSIFGNGWTNTYDAHMVVRSSGQIISVYDIDGTRCDYTANTDGTWTPCSGEHAILEVDPNSQGCSYWWIKKSGTAYWFHSPFQSCINQPANVGRVYAIYGRNSNNYVTLNYSFVPNEPQTTQYITEVDVNHSDGQSLVMKFGQLGTSGPNELSEVDRPDGNKIKYYYDNQNQGYLQEVDRPGNDNATILPETYGIQAPIQFACGPRATISKQQNNGNGTDGACLHFDYDSNLNLIDWQVSGVLNPDPLDGYGKIQPGITQSWQTFYTANFVYGYGNGTPCGHTLAGTTTLCDSDGHATVWTVDSSSRVTQTQASTGPSTSLVTTQTWGDQNNLLATTDARANETDYGYDSNGNTVEVRQPYTASSPGPLRPMSLYSYDSFNNVTAYCDPVSNVGKSPPDPNNLGDNLCPTTLGSGNAVYQYTYTNDEPYGRLTSIYTPCYNANCQDGGNYTQISYDPSKQGGSLNYGLPTSVVGKSYTQKDTTQRQPEEDFTYDGNGNLQTFITGQPQGYGGGKWILAYDAMNRVVSRQDPDGYTSYTCYNWDDTLNYTETAYQHSLDGGAACVANASSGPSFAAFFTHDADGDILHEDHHHGGTAYPQPTSPPNLNGTKGTTKKYYDGEDRLVEVIQPTDGNSDVYQNPWITRYYYDLTEGAGAANLSFQGKSGSFAGYGNLYKTVELLPSATNGVVNWGNAPRTAPATPAPLNPVNNSTLTDINAAAFDALDRPTAKYSIVYTNSNEQLATETLTYDASPNLGFLTSDCQIQVNECKNYSYDSIGHVNVDSFTPNTNTPERDITYDPDGRTVQIVQQGSAGDSETYTYDLDGRLLKAAKATGANITYDYYLDGKRKSLSGSALDSEAFDYSYAPDGTLQQQNYSFNGGSYWGKLLYTLTAAGRVSERDDYSNGVGPMKTTRQYANALLAEEDFPCSNCGGSHPDPGSHKLMEYSAEGELLGQMVTAPWSFYQQQLPSEKQYAQTWFYNSRGEVVATFDHNHNETDSRYANGVLVASFPKGSSFPSPTTFEGAQGTWDARMGATISSAYSSQTPGTGNVTLTGQTSGVSYDAAGRNVSSGYQGFCSYSQGSGGCNSPLVSQTTTRTYDVENHVISSHGSYYPGSTITTNYTWGSNGHPRLIGSGGSSDAAFWDGNALLYSRTQNGNGAVDDIKIGSDAEYTPNDTYKNVTFYDRGVDGSVAFCHNASGGSGGLGDGDASMTQNRYWSGGPSNPCGPPALPSWGMQYPVQVAWNSSYAASGGVGNGSTIGEPRADGITDGVNTIQGVRAYDPTAGQWTTPDAYAGDVRDPMSQKAYVWNNNNPVLYSDPTGYCANVVACVITFGVTVEGASIAAASAGAAATAGAIVVLVGGAILATTARTAPGDLATAMARQNTPSVGAPNTAARRGNTVTYYGPQGTRVKRVDLEGKAHGGVETPHTTTYGKPNIGPDGTVHPGNAEGTRPSTPGEVQDANNRPQGSSPQEGSDPPQKQ